MRTVIYAWVGLACAAIFLTTLSALSTARGEEVWKSEVLSNVWCERLADLLTAMEIHDAHLKAFAAGVPEAEAPPSGIEYLMRDDNSCVFMGPIRVPLDVLEIVGRVDFGVNDDGSQRKMTIVRAAFESGVEVYVSGQQTPEFILRKGWVDALPGQGV